MQKTHGPFKPSKICLEEAWLDAIGGYSNRASPDIWENVIGFTPLDQWSPDTVFNVGGHGNIKKTTLAQYWMLNHVGYWKPFIERITLAYPDLKDDVVVYSAIAGMRTTYANRGRYEAAGDEVVVLDWLKSYKDKWLTNQDYKDALLNQAIEVDFLGLSEYLIEKGAAVQPALRFVTTKKAYDLLIKAGANPFVAGGDDKRDLAPELCEERRNNFGPNFAKPTVYEELVSRDDNAFASAKERETIINDMAKKRLKVKAGEAAAPEEERRQMLFDTIANAKKKKEVITAIRACMPDCWSWRDENDNGKTVILALAASGDLDNVKEALNKKFPEDAFSSVDSLGQNIFVYAGKASVNCVTWPYSYETLVACCDVVKPTVEGAFEVIKDRVFSPNNKGSSYDKFPRCPAQDKNSELLIVYKDGKVIQGENVKTELMSNFWQIPQKEFWKEAVSFSEKNPEFIEKMCTKLVENTSSWNRSDVEANDWSDAFKTLNKGEGLKEIGSWTKFACLLDIHNVSAKVRGYWSSELDKKNAEIDLAKVVEKWSGQGVAVKDVLTLMGKNKSSYSFVLKLGDKMVALAERKLLSDRAAKAMEQPKKPTTKDLFSGAL